MITSTSELNNPACLLLFMISDWFSGKHELVGHFQTNAAELQVGKEFPLIHPVAQKSKKHYTNSGWSISL